MDKKKYVPILQVTAQSDIKDKMRIAVELDKEFDLGITPIVSNRNRLYLNNLRSLVPENFCVYPFIHLQIDPDGRARPCCKYKVGDSSWQHDVPKLPDVNIDELWHQPELQELRSQLLRNEKPSGCRACWDEEKAGIKSMRVTYEDAGKMHPESTFFAHIPRHSPRSLDLKLSNLCNLKCRICTPFLSSQWIKEHKDLMLGDASVIKMYTENSKEKLFKDPINAEILRAWAKNIDHLEFYGGEPLLQQEHEQVLSIINEFGNPAQTKIWYNTNTTICEEKFFKVWKNFNEITISLSIDDIAQRFEYQRMNAKWIETLDNINKFKVYGTEYNVNLKLQIYVTVGSLNVFYLKELIEFVRDNLDLPIVFNMVHYPHHYSIVNLPESVKLVVAEKLRSIDLSTVNMLEWSPTIDNLIRFMNDRACNQDELKKFFDTTKLHDEYRKQEFSEIFPELYSLLKEYNV
jgi:sulfatase maturation enzyme AslB (radical SAM superfamily)